MFSSGTASGSTFRADTRHRATLPQGSCRSLSYSGQPQRPRPSRARRRRPFPTIKGLSTRERSSARTHIASVIVSHPVVASTHAHGTTHHHGHPPRKGSGAGRRGRPPLPPPHSPAPLPLSHESLSPLRRGPSGSRSSYHSAHHSACHSRLTALTARTRHACVAPAFCSSPPTPAVTPLPLPERPPVRPLESPRHHTVHTRPTKHLAPHAA